MKLMLALITALVCFVTTGCQQQAPVYASTYTSPAPPPSPGVYTTIIGDSYTGGSPSGGRGTFGWPALVSDMLRAQGTPIAPTLATESGSGYVNDGIHEGRIFDDQILSRVGNKTQLIVLVGSANDQGADPADLAIAVRKAIADARAVSAPNSKVIMIGPAWVTPDPDPRLLRVRDIVKAEADSAGVRFVDPLGEGWFTARPDLIGANGDHPNDAGHVLMAEKIAPVIAEELQTLPPQQ